MRNWRVTDIYAKEVKLAENEENATPEITKLCFKDVNGKEIIESIPTGSTVTLYAETKGIEEGDSVVFTITKDDGNKVQVEGVVGKHGIVEIKEVALR